ncbi:hypothetical protein [Streptomyces sp. DW26H14]
MKCWICGEPGAEMERTLLGFKKPLCPPGKGLCGKRRTPKTKKTR